MLPGRRWYFLLLVPALLGCGYRPLGSGTASPEGRPSLAIPLFGNRSTEVGLEATMANALIHAFSQTKAVRVARRTQEAELVLDGKVQSAENTSVAFLDITRSTVRRLTLRVDLVLTRRSSGKILWKDSLVLQEDYVVDPNYHVGEANKTEGIRRVAATMARRVVDKVLLVL